MAVLRILDYPDPRLRTVAKPLQDFTETRAQQMIDDMLETLNNTEHCGGLAATQLDIIDPYRIFVFYDFDEEKSTPPIATVAINPEIVATEGEVFEDEGCMSVYPDYIGAKVVRPAKTHMRAFDRKGNSFDIIRTGYLAKNFMHEIDHLNGKLYIDHLKPIKRNLVDGKIKKVKRVLDNQPEK